MTNEELSVMISGLKNAMEKAESINHFLQNAHDPFPAQLEAGIKLIRSLRFALGDQLVRRMERERP